MKKLKDKKINNILNYQPFLKNNFLKSRPLKLRKIFFDTPFLYKNPFLEASIIEFNNYENIALPFTLIKVGEISTIESKYENVLLFNYDITNTMLKQFNKIMFPYILKFYKNYILVQGRVLGTNGRKGKKKRIIISILGRLFQMKLKHLNTKLDFQKRYYFNKYNKRGLYKKRVNANRLINSYRLRDINLTINNTHIPNKKILSRVSYVRLIIKENRLRDKRRRINIKKKQFIKNQLNIKKKQKGKSDFSKKKDVEK